MTRQGTESRVTRRRWLGTSGVLSAGGASGVLAACAGNEAAAPAAKTQGPTTIRFAAAGVGTELQIWTEVTSTYNALNTGITVQYEPCTAGAGNAQDCLPVYFTQFVAGSAPDVWRVDDEPLWYTMTARNSRRSWATLRSASVLTRSFDSFATCPSSWSRR